MKIITKAKNLELTEALQNYIDEKAEMLEKFISAINEEIFIEVEKETNHHNKGEIFSCQMEIKLPGKNLVAKESSDDLYNAILNAKKEMEELIIKHKEKEIENHRRVQKQNKNEIEI